MRRCLVEEEQAPWREQRKHVLNRLAQVPGGVKHVSGDDEVEVPEHKSLFLGAPLQIQDPVAHEGKGGKALCSARQ